MSTAPYDNLITVLNTVKVRLGDALDTLLPLGGQLAGNGNYNSQQLVNTGWRKLQERLVSEGCVLLQPPPPVIPGFTPASPVDPSNEPWVDWTGYFNGTSLNTSLVLPQDLIEPIEVQERSAGSGSFNRMDLILGIMPGVAQSAWNGSWQWRQGKLVLAGATATFDLRLSYAGYFPDFADTGDVTTAIGFVPWYNQPVPIMRSFQSLVSYTCAEIEIARGNQSAALAYVAEAEDAIQMIIDKDYMRAKEPVKTADIGVPAVAQAGP